MAEESLSIADQQEEGGKPLVYSVLYGDKINNVQFNVKDASGTGIDLNAAITAGGDFGIRIYDKQGENRTLLSEHKATEADTNNQEITSPSLGVMQWYQDPANWPSTWKHDYDHHMEFFWDDDGDGDEKLGIRILRVKG